MIERPVNRIEPQGDPSLYKTYAMLRPKATHTRIATCQEVNCPSFLKGWRTMLDVSTELGVRQARYIREHSGRAFIVTKKPDAGNSTLVMEFAPGQQCFREHRVPVEREPLFVVKGGDYRGNPLGLPTVQRTRDEWLDDFGNHQLSIAEAVKRG